MSACRFIDNHECLVLIDDVERDSFGGDGRIVVWTVEHEADHITGAYLVVALHRLVVDMHKSCVGSFLYAVATGVLQFLEKKLIYSHRHLSFVGSDAEMFVELL